MKHRNTKGFTLGEVLLVVAIISALTAIGIPSLMREIDKAKLRVDQAHVQEAVSMATSQYAADHTEGKRWYYYDANRSEIKKDTSEGIHGYGKSTKEPYKHNTHVTDNSASSVPVGADGTRNLVEVTVNVEHGVSTITSSWVQSGNHPYTPPQHNKDNSDKKTFGDVEITAAGSWPVKEVDFPKRESPLKSVNWGYVYTYNGDYYLMRYSPGYTYGYDWCVSPLGRRDALKLTSDLFSNILSEADVIEKNKKGEVGVNLIVKSNTGQLYITQNGWDLVGSDGKIKFDSTEKFCPIYGAILKQ